MKSIKQILRSILVLPLHPYSLRPWLALARKAGLLPPRASVANPFRRILVANLTTYVGDGVMMMPFLQYLRKANPNAQIELVTTSAIGSLFEPLSLLDRFHCLQRATTTVPVWSAYRRIQQMLQLVRSMQHNPPFDVCFLPRWGTDPGMSAWIALFAGISDIRGYDPSEDTYGGTTVPGAHSILTYAATGGQDLTEAMRELRLLEVTGVSGPINYRHQQRKSVEPLLSLKGTVNESGLFQKLGLNPSLSYFALCPGASNPGRRWPAERFAQAANDLHIRFSIRSLILGGAGDALLGDAIHFGASNVTINLCGKTSLPELVVLLAKATLVVANDSGPAHLGAGLGTPTIVLSACPEDSTVEHAGSPQRVFPVGPFVRVLQPHGNGFECTESCAYHEPHCILGLSVNQISNVAEELLVDRLTGTMQG